MFGPKTALFLCAASLVSSFELGAQDVVFHLFSRGYEESQPLFANMNILMASRFNHLLPTVITIHGHGESVSGNFNAFLVPVHLDVADVNVIAVDWSIGSHMYTQGLGNAPQCAERIAEFINLLGVFQYGPENFRIVGVGLGAHIAGIAARQVNGVIPHIIALDPSLFGWAYHPLKLSPSDAAVVEVIHTTAGIQGYDFPLGDIDFYPNGGSYQNGCGLITSCSHVLSYVFYAESINQAIVQGNQFVGTKCDSYEQAVEKTCEGPRDATFGGPEVKESASGIYYFTTNFVQPFAMD